MDTCLARPMRRRRVTALLGGSVAALLGGCALPRRPVTTPIERLVDPAPGGTARELLVMLPGAYDTPRDLAAQDFVGAVRRRGAASLEMQLVDAHVGYYTERSVTDRLRQDVLAPAGRAGVAQVWLAGISIGGFGALLTARDAEADPAPASPPVAGLLLLAPYLGPRRLVAEIVAAGSLAAWDARPGDTDEPERRLWRWLQARLAPGAAVPAPPIWLGFGRDDRFAAGHRLLAGALPPERVFEVDGGHDWAPWREAWGRMLAAAPMLGRA